MTYKTLPKPRLVDLEMGRDLQNIVTSTPQSPAVNQLMPQAPDPLMGEATQDTGSQVSGYPLQTSSVLDAKSLKREDRTLLEQAGTTEIQELPQCIRE
jgi:hypothetical protein